MASGASHAGAEESAGHGITPKTTVRTNRTKTGKPVRFFRRGNRGGIDNNISFAFLCLPTKGHEERRGRVRKPGERSDDPTGATTKWRKSGN
jgi:hypothetical protein